jgi:hypothetical protein
MNDDHIYKKSFSKKNVEGPKVTNSNIHEKSNNITVISSPFSITISIITLVILLFIFMNKE